ncbi:MAG TPA: hypothetical protein OGM06_13120 [Clostridiales bacterium]|nr:hypothetical protein [Clostridiales bacterium]
MATIICKRNKFNVVYSYYDEAGKRHQKWEAFSTMPEAKQRKSEIEYKQQLGSFTIPTCNTLNELLKEYVSLYGKTKWAINGYSSNTGLIQHYISPKLGELRLKEITPRVLEMFYQGLLKTPAVPLMTDKKYRQTGKFVQLGAEYHDYNLVIAGSRGQPVESNIIRKSMRQLIEANELPQVCFHSLRHSSITYKLKLNGGDINTISRFTCAICLRLFPSGVRSFHLA